MAHDNRCFDKNCWILDSGASSHISNDRSLFSNIQSIEPIEIGLAGTNSGGKQISILAEHKGSVRIKLRNGENCTSTVVLQDVLYAPDAMANIVSVRKITAGGSSEIRWQQVYTLGK